MKFIVLALALSVAFAVSEGVVSSATTGTATWANATTMAASVCTVTPSIVYSTILVVADRSDFTFLFTTAAAVANLDSGFQCTTPVTATAGLIPTGITCSTVVFTSALIRTGVTSLTVTYATAIQTANAGLALSFTVAAPLSTINIAWNSTLNSGKIKTFLHADGTTAYAATYTFTAAAATAAAATTVDYFASTWTGDFTACETGAKSFWKSDVASSSFLSGLLALSFF